MLGGGIVQRFGDLIRGQRSNQKRIDEVFITPTLKATQGTVNDDTLLYGVEVKFYNMELNEKLVSGHKGLYIIVDGSGITHSLSQASASGVHVARNIVA